MNKFSIVVLVVLVSSLFLSSPELSSDTANAANIEGIDYSHGWVSFSESGTFEHVETGFITETYSENVLIDTTIPLIISSELVDILYRLDEVYYRSDGTNGTATYWHNNESFFIWADLTTSDPFLTEFNYTEGYSLEMCVAISTENEFMGQFPVNTTKAVVTTDVIGLITVREIIVTPVAIIFEITKQLFDVTYNRTRAAFSYLGYYSAYSMDYSVEGHAYQVSVTDGERFGFQALMFDNVSSSYTETSVFVLGYHFVEVDYTELTFLNGTPVDWSMYPRDMLPKIAESEGQIIESAYNQVNITAITTFQSLTAAFLSLSSNSTVDHARLAIWSTQKATTMLAFKDGNNNSMLDLAWTNEGIVTDNNDFLTHVGFGEAYSISRISAFRHSQEQNFSLQLPGYGIDISEENANQTVMIVDFQQFEFGDVDATRSTVAVWEEPQVLADGTVKFEFGIIYNDFPVTWVSTMTGKAVIDPELIKYMYILLINPEEGTATISPTFTFGGINNPGLKTAMADTSLAFPILMEFLAVEAIHSVTETETDVNATRTVSGSYFEVENGLGDSFVEIALPEDKKIYTAGGVEHEAYLSALSLITIKGGAYEEKTVPLNSETQGSTGTATLNAQKELYAFAFYYTVNLLIVSYPTWNGDQVVHDPDYNLAFEPRIATDTGTDTTDTDTTVTTATTDTTDETTTDTEAPGFDLIVSMLVLAPLAVIVRRRKSS
jgi:hypothetical protein